MYRDLLNFVNRLFENRSFENRLFCNVYRISKIVELQTYLNMENSADCGVNMWETVEEPQLKW